MPHFSKTSMDRLKTTHPELQRLFNDVIETRDCSILCGNRIEADQNKAYSEGKSKLKFPESKHNEDPSSAVDVAPYPIDWDDIFGFYYFAGYVQSRADALGIPIRWGGDWDSDGDFHDQSFNDLPHFELAD